MKFWKAKRGMDKGSSQRVFFFNFLLLKATIRENCTNNWRNERDGSKHGRAQHILQETSVAVTIHRSDCAW